MTAHATPEENREGVYEADAARQREAREGNYPPRVVGREPNPVPPIPAERGRGAWDVAE